jgi:hypothetical protein
LATWIAVEDEAGSWKFMGAFWLSQSFEFWLIGELRIDFSSTDKKEAIV